MTWVRILISVILTKWELLRGCQSPSRSDQVLKIKKQQSLKLIWFSLKVGRDLTFRTSWFFAFPIAFWFFANWFAFWFGCLAVSDAMGLFAYSNAFRAVKHFAAFIWAFDFTYWFLTFYIANCVFRFCTRCVASGGFAHRIANCWAVGVIALPRTLGMALFNFNLIISYRCLAQSAAYCRNINSSD